MFKNTVLFVDYIIFEYLFFKLQIVGTMENEEIKILLSRSSTLRWSGLPSTRVLSINMRSALRSSWHSWPCPIGSPLNSHNIQFNKLYTIVSYNYCLFIKKLADLLSFWQPSWKVWDSRDLKLETNL